MLVECGFVRATTSDGAEYTFTPSLGRIASLGTPHEIVAMFAALHGPDPAPTAAYVLACLCDQDDPLPLIGGVEIDPGDSAAPDRRLPGLMPVAEQIVIAQHLMRHGIVGKAKPNKAGSGAYSERFDAAEFVAAARAHFGMSAADAEALSMTELQLMIDMKFPEQANRTPGGRDVPTREEYEAAMAKLEERRRG